jgi:hypothetical protein
MSVPFQALVLRYVTVALQPAKYLPSTMWLFYQVIQVCMVNPWDFWSIWSNIYQIMGAIWQSFGVYLLMALYIPVDLWINFESFVISDTLKTVEGFDIWFIRIMSWVVNTYSVLVATGFVAEGISVALASPGWVIGDSQTVVETMSSLFALATGINYLFQVNAYLPYL